MTNEDLPEELRLLKLEEERLKNKISNLLKMLNALGVGEDGLPLKVKKDYDLDLYED